MPTDGCRDPRATDDVIRDGSRADRGPMECRPRDPLDAPGPVTGSLGSTGGLLPPLPPDDRTSRDLSLAT